MSGDHGGHKSDAHGDAHSHGHEHGGHDAHGHRHAHHRRRLGERRRLFLALGLTSVVFVAELAGGLISHSLALLSDAGHMLSDVAAQVLSLVALVIASLPSDSRRTYGYYRIEILAALANGLALFGLSGWIFWSAALRLQGGPIEIHTRVMIAVAVVGLIANIIGAFILHGAESLNVRGAYLHVVQDLLSSVVVVIGGIVMAFVPAWSLLDPVLSIAIGLFVLYGAVQLVRDAVDVLLEAVPTGIDVAAVCRALSRQPRVVDVHDLHLWSLTSGVFALSAHIVVAEESLGAQDAMIAAMNDVLLREFRISHTTIQVESPTFEHVGFTCAHGHDHDAPATPASP